MLKMNKLILKDGTQLKKGNFYWWSGYSEGLYTTYTWKNTLCKITDIKNDNIAVIFEVFANEEYVWSVESLNENCTFKEILLRRTIDWFKKMVS